MIIRLPISAIIMIGMAGILFFLFIGFNYAFNSPGGFVETIWDSANETMDGYIETRFDNSVNVMKQGFGVGAVLCFLLAIAFFVIEVLHEPRGGVRY